MSPGVRAMVWSALAFSGMTLLVKVAGRELPSQEIVLARAVISLVLSWAIVRRAGVSLWGERRPLLLLRGLVGFVGLSCFGVAVGMDFLEGLDGIYESIAQSAGVDTYTVSHTSKVIEETLEMMGTTAFFYCFASQLATALSGSTVRFGPTTASTGE